MTLTWLQATIYPRVRRCRIRRAGLPEALAENADFAALRPALVEAWPELRDRAVPSGLVIELWDEKTCLATICPEPGVILVGTRLETALADRGIQCAFWLAKRGFPETLARIQKREMTLLEASRTVLSHRLHLEGEAARAHWLRVAPAGLGELWSLFEAQERESTQPLAMAEFEALLGRELERRLPDQLERARALLIWLGRGFDQNHRLLAPHLMASALYRLPDQLAQLAERQSDPEVSLGLTVLLRSASAPLSKSQRRLRKALIAYLNL